jgi:undecaprenyl-diphosphatase
MIRRWRWLETFKDEAQAIAAPAFLIIGAPLLIVVVLEHVVGGDRLAHSDAAVYHALQNMRTGSLDLVLIGITELGDTAVVVTVTTVVFLWLAWKRVWRMAAYWIAAVAGASALNTAIKVALQRARPSVGLYTGWKRILVPKRPQYDEYGLVRLPGVSRFDSRPAGMAPPRNPRRNKPGPLIAFSRLYFGAHWASDEIGGLAFGSAWLGVLGHFYLRRERQSIEPGRLLAVGCAALFIAGSLENILQACGGCGTLCVEEHGFQTPAHLRV